MKRSVHGVSNWFTKTATTTTAAMLMFAAGPAAMAQHEHHEPGKEAEKATEQPKSDSTGDPYMLDTCPVSGDKLGPDAVTKTYEGREVRFCCDKCPKQFEKTPAVYWKKIDEKIIAQQTAWYPLETCVVSGEKLGGDMGAPVDYVYRNRLVRFCCKMCIQKFEAEPAKFTAKIDAAAIEKQSATYPLKKCPVSGETLGGDMGAPVDKVFGNRLVRFCCADCVKDFKANPLKYLTKIDDARGGKKEGEQG